MTEAKDIADGLRAIVIRDIVNRESAHEAIDAAIAYLDAQAKREESLRLVWTMRQDGRWNAPCPGCRAELVGIEEEARAVAEAWHFKRCIGAKGHEKPAARTFDEAWAEKERTGYQYGKDALEQVRFGWDIAMANLAPPARLAALGRDDTYELLRVMHAARAWVDAQEKLEAARPEFTDEHLREVKIGYLITAGALRDLDKLAPAGEAPAKPTHGVWSCNDGAWCDGTEGTEAYALNQLPSWQSGEAAAVDPTRYRYEVRPLAPAPAAPAPAGKDDWLADGEPGQCRARCEGYICRLREGHSGDHSDTLGMAGWPKDREAPVAPPPAAPCKHEPSGERDGWLWGSGVRVSVCRLCRCVYVPEPVKP